MHRSAARDQAPARIYLYIYDFRSSGVVRDALTYAARIAAERPVTLVASYGEGFFRAAAEEGPFDLAVLAERAGKRALRFAAVPRLRKWLRLQPPGVLMSAGNYGHPTVYLAGRGIAHIRRVYRISNEIAGPVKGEGPLRTLWLRLLMNDAARIVLVGQAMNVHALIAPALASGHAVAFPSGVDIDRARVLAQAPTPHPWLEQDVPVVLAIGRLRPQKNLELLVEAVAIARRTRPLRLIVIGGGTIAAQAHLTALAGDYADDFLLAGETGNVFAWLARAAAFALPSRWEGSSLALLEAMAVGTPVVASRLAGDAALVLDEGRYGLLFDGADPAALAHALLRQTSADRVPPGDRAEHYALARSADLYAGLLTAIADGE